MKNRKYNVTINYKLPSKQFHPSYQLSLDFYKYCKDKGWDVDDVFNAYVDIALNNLDEFITKLIKHDLAVYGTGKRCLIDEYIDKKNEK